MRKSDNLTLLARNLRSLRNRKRLSQDRLFEPAVVSHNTIVKVEAGAIRSPTAQKIARALGVSLDDLTKE